MIISKSILKYFFCIYIIINITLIAKSVSQENWTSNNAYVKQIKINKTKVPYYYASIDGGDEFLIGKKTSYESYIGISNEDYITGTINKSEKYSNEKYRINNVDSIWCDLIYPTAVAESEGGTFDIINTYDAAYFTFGFFQFTVHDEPVGDFTRFLHYILLLPNAKEYYPDLEIMNNRVYNTRTNKDLEKDHNKGLIEYFNTSRKEIDDNELINAAKMIDWSFNDEQFKRLQVQTTIEHIKKKLRVYYKYVPRLQDACDIVVLLIMDIKHQGRIDSYDEINDALDEGSARNHYRESIDELLSIGKDDYPVRIATLKKEIDILKEAKKLDKYFYDAINNTFLEIK